MVEVDLLYPGRPTSHHRQQSCSFSASLHMMLWQKSLSVVLLEVVVIVAVVVAKVEIFCSAWTG